MKTYFKKPEIVQAIEITESNFDEIKSKFDCHDQFVKGGCNDFSLTLLDDSKFQLNFGDFLMQNGNGKLSILDKPTFLHLYGLAFE